MLTLTYPRSRQASIGLRLFGIQFATPFALLCSQRQKKKRKRNHSGLGRRADVPQKNWRSPGASGGPARIGGAFRPPPCTPRLAETQACG